MSPEEVQALLAQELNDCQVNVDGDGHKYDITVIGAVFEGLNAVKRQQYVYAALNDKIKDGTIHAVTINTFTPDQWSDRQS